MNLTDGCQKCTVMVLYAIKKLTICASSSSSIEGQLYSVFHINLYRLMKCYEKI